MSETNGNSVVVSIVGDAAGVRPAVEQTKSELGGLKGIVADVAASFGRFGADVKEGFRQGIAEAEKFENELKQVRGEADKSDQAIRRMGGGAQQAGHHFSVMGGFVKGAIQGVIASLTVGAITAWANSIGEAAEQAEQMAQRTGMTVGQVQALDGALAQSGLKVDDVATSLGMMALKAEMTHGKTQGAANAMKAMGISARDNVGALDRLLRVSDRFKNMEDGPRKAALAMQLFGQQGQKMIPFLNQGSAAIREQMAAAERYGLVNERATERALALNAALDQGKLAFAGLKQTLADAFAPLFTSLAKGFADLVAGMTESYNKGGAVKIIFDAIVLAAQVVRDVIHAVGAGFAEIFSNTADADDWGATIEAVFTGIGQFAKALIAAVVAVADGFKIAFHLCYAAVLNFKANWNENVGQIKLIGTALGMFMEVLGKVCEDALMLRWGSIRSDWDAGMENIRQTVAAKGAQIVAEAKATRSQVQEQLQAINNIKSSFGGFLAGINAPAGMPPDARLKPTGGGGGGNAVPNFSPTGGGSKKAGMSLAEKLEAELEAKKVAWAKEQDAQGTFQQYSLQSEADFWAAALKRADLGAKDKLAIEKKYLAARQALKRDEIEIQLDGYREQIDAAGANSDRKLEILRTEQAYIRRIYGDESKEARKAAQEVVRAEREKAAQLRELETAIANGKTAAALARVDAEEAAAQAEVEMGRRTAGQMIALDRQFENQRFEIRRKAALDSLKLAQLDPNTSPAKLREIYNQIEELERQHQAKLTQIDRAATMQRTRLQRGAIDQVSSSWADSIARMITLQTGWRDGLISIYQGLVSTIASVIQQIVQQWIAAFLTKLILGKQEAVSSVASQAAAAGAGGTASMAAAPFPINLSAPAFGASMAAAAMSFAGLASAEGGDWKVREGLYQLHADEMVLPAWAAGSLRSMLSGGRGGGGRDATKSAGGSRESNFHYAPTINHHDAKWERMMQREARQARRWFKNQARNGALSLPES